MLYEMHHDLRGMLELLGFPTRWVYGPTPTDIDGYHDSLIVIERDRNASDTIRAVQGVQRNARKMRVRDLAAQLRIYARSTVPSAHIGNHERECEKIVDALIVALEEWGTAGRAGNIPITEAKYLSAAEREDVEVWPGVVYSLKFFVPRSVQKRDYAGQARPEGGPAKFASRTEVSSTTSPNAPPAVGCDADPA